MYPLFRFYVPDFKIILLAWIVCPCCYFNAAMAAKVLFYVPDFKIAALMSISAYRAASFKRPSH